MAVTKKDKSLILLFLSLIIVVWLFLSLLASLFGNLVFLGSDFNKSISSYGKDAEWFNVSKSLKSSDLKGRIILLDFWTYSCVSCLHMVPEIKKLEEEFADKLTVVGVHSGRFGSDKVSKNIKNAIIKYGIEYPVLNDNNLVILKNFAVSSLPTMFLLNPKGRVEKVYVGEGNSEKLRKDVKKLAKKYRHDLNKDRLPIFLERDKVVGHILKYPSKLEYGKGFSFGNIPTTSVIFIANTGGNNIIVTSLTGKILLKIGSNKEGFEDGTIDRSSFSAPRGMLYKNGILYVADTGNHALRKIDFKDNKVTTLIGSGIRGGVVRGDLVSKEVDLSSPWDLEFFPDGNNIAIANAGSNQILQYDIARDRVRVLAGDGVKSMRDGKYPDNSLAQTSALDFSDGKLYFTDPESSSLRVIDRDGNVRTLIGKGLSDFGNSTGGKDRALMQHPMGLLVNDSSVYVADSFNNLIRKYDFESQNLSDYGSETKVSGLTDKVSYNQPEDIMLILNQFYIADSNNNRIVVINRIDGTYSVLDVMPELKLPKDGLSEYLPNLEKIPAAKVQNDSEVIVMFKMKKGWKMNELGPSFFNLVEIKGGREANLIAAYDWNAINSGSIKLPKLSDDNQYYLQGTVYYCEDKRNAICLIRSYEQKLIPKKIGGDKEVKVDFVY